MTVERRMGPLTALAERYDRMASRGEAPVPGFAPAQIAFSIVLRPDGSVAAVRDERVPVAKKKPRPRSVVAPQVPKRTVAVVSGTYWDKTSYVLGVTADDTTASEEKRARTAERTAREHEAFKTQQRKVLEGADDAGAKALLAFLSHWTPAALHTLRYADELIDQNVAFSLEGDDGFLHDRPALRARVGGTTAESNNAAKTQCLVTGEVGPIARLHPAIKGVPGSQQAGASLVSFNASAFTSYGNDQGANAPTAETAAFGYGTALNALLTAASGTDAKGRPRWSNRAQIGDATTVFWVDAETGDAAQGEAILGSLFDGPPDEKEIEAEHTHMVREVLRQLEAGRPLRDIDERIAGLRVYVLGLSPNAARLSVRFWHVDTLGELATRFQEHWGDLRLEPAPGRKAPAVWALLYELAPLRKIDEGLNGLAGEITRAIITGADYPGSMLARALVRVRAEHDANWLRTSVIKAALTRHERRDARANGRQWKDRYMSLNREEPNQGYRLGRLFAVLDAAQYAGLGRRVNASVKDKFFGSASATPRHVFPSLLRGAQDHLSAARKKNRAGRAARLEKEMSEILAGFPAPGFFPPTLAMEDQGAFVVGYYHQDQDLRTAAVPGEVVEPADDDEGGEEE